MFLGSLILAAGAVGPVAAANNVRFVAIANDCQFEGTNAGSGKTVKIEWRDSDGNLKSKHQVKSTGAGTFLTRCEPDEFIEPFDQLRAYVGGAWRSFDVPQVRLYADRVANEVNGDVFPLPPGGEMLVTAFAFGGGFDPASATAHESWAPIGANNVYWAQEWDTAPDIESWDEVYATWFSAQGDQFIKFAYVPGFRAWIRQPFIDFVGSRPATIDAELLNSNGSGIASIVRATYDLLGRYRGMFVDSNGEPVRIRPDFQVDAPQGFGALTVPDVAATINKSTDRVTVDCGFDDPGSTGFLVHAHSRDYARSGVRTGFQNNASTAVANFASSPTVNIVSGDKIDVQCKAPSGDIFARTFTVP